MSEDTPLKATAYKPTPGGKISDQELYRHLTNIQQDLREVEARITRLAARVAALEAAP